MSWVGHIFTFLFTIELSLRIPAYKAHFFLGAEWQWNAFDTIIVLSAWAELIFSSLGGFSGDGHLADFCVVTWLLHYPILKVSAWTSAMGAMAKRRGNCHVSHGNKVTMARRRLGKMSWRSYAPMAKRS